MIGGVFSSFLSEEKKSDQPASSVVDIPHLLARTLEYEEKVPVPTHDGIYRVSRLVSLCPRQESLMAKHGVEGKSFIDARLKQTFDFGRAFHSVVQNEWLAKHGLWGIWVCQRCGRRHGPSCHPSKCSCGYEVFLYEEINIKNDSLGIEGHLDGLIQNGSSRSVLELKTCNSKQYDLCVRMKKRPLESHIKQVQMYMFLSGCVSAVILYFHKDESYLHQFDVQFDKSVVDDVLSSLKSTRDAIAGGYVVSEKVCDSYSCTRAKRCSVRDICFSKGEKRNG